MELKLFLFSRTKSKDYHYIMALPNNLSERANAFIQQRRMDLQMDNTINTIHFFVSDTEAILLRIIDSGAFDAYGRPISAMEGFYCPKEDIRTFWLCLPRIVPGFHASSSMYSSIVQQETILPVSIPKLLDTFESVGQSNPQTPVVTKTICDAQTPACFTYDNDGLHLSVSSNPERRTVWTPKETRQCNLEIILDKKEKTAQFQAMASHAPAYEILQSEEISCTSNGWPISDLQATAAAMEQQLYAKNWKISGVKQQGGTS